MIKFEISNTGYILRYVGKNTHDYEMIVDGSSKDFITERDVREFIQQHQTKNHGPTIGTLDF
jgi:hypothetical protein